MGAFLLWVVGSVRTSSPRAFFAHQLVGDGDDEASNVSCALSCWGFLNVKAFCLCLRAVVSEEERWWWDKQKRKAERFAQLPVFSA
jgi:hypothetical protein